LPGAAEDGVDVWPWWRCRPEDGVVVGVDDGLSDWLGAGGVVLGLTAVGDGVVGAGDTIGVVEAAGAYGGLVRGTGGTAEAGGSVAFGSRVSTLVFSRFTWSMRSFLLVPSFMACTALLTSAS